MNAGDRSILPARLPPLAQTNLALYRQLHDLGYAASDLVYIRDCYELAATLFIGLLRGSGKPFLAHLVGTASALAAMKTPVAVIAAGLLHASYDQGDFGIMRWRRRRQRVRAIAGSDAEAFVWHYHEMPWSPAQIPLLQGRVARLSTMDRIVVQMRLANELDDNLDMAMRYCHEGKDAYRDCQGNLVSLARELGEDALATTLDATYRESSEAVWAKALSLGRGDSYQLASTFGLKLLKPAKVLQRIVTAITRSFAR